MNGLQSQTSSPHKPMQRIDCLNDRLLEAATQTLTEAFCTDPLLGWIFSDAAKGSQAFPNLFRVLLRYGLRHGRVTQSDQAKAVAVWTPPGHSVTTVGMIRAGILAMPFRVGFRTFSKFLGVVGVIERMRKRHASEPHWYLMLLGVDKELQGQGRGAALVNEGLARADREALPCYLETGKDHNLRFYERFGFQTVESTRLGTGGPEVWAMLRKVKMNQSPDDH